MLRSHRPALLLATGLIAVAALAAACSSSDRILTDEDTGASLATAESPSPAATTAETAYPTRTRIPTRTPTPEPTPQPLSTVEPESPPVLDIPEVDAVVAAVFEGDTDALLALASYASVPCTSSGGGIGAPPGCETLNLAPGTPIDVLPTGTCEGSLATPAGAEAFLSDFFGTDAPPLDFAGLYVPTRAGSVTVGAPAADYAVMFRPRAPLPDDGLRPYREIRLHEGRIVSTWGGCDATVPFGGWVDHWLIGTDEAAWRVVLADQPVLTQVAIAGIAGPGDVAALTAKLDRPCSARGERFSFCDRLGFGSTFSGIAVAIDICEWCEVPEQQFLASLSHIYASGSVEFSSFWGGIDPVENDVPDAVGVDLVGAWVIDDDYRGWVEAIWPELTAGYALAFVARDVPPHEDTGAIGFIAVVDPGAPRPISIIRPLSWDAGTADQIPGSVGIGWTPIYLKQ